MKNYGFIQRLSESFPYERKSTASWLLPASIGVGIGVALGVGIGLLVSSRLTETQRRPAGLALLLVGALTTIPLALEVFGGSRVRSPG